MFIFKIFYCRENNSVTSFTASNVIKNESNTDAVLLASYYTKNENEKYLDLSTPPLKRTKLTCKLASFFDNKNLSLAVSPYKKKSKTYPMRSYIEEKEILYRFQQVLINFF